MTTKKRKIKIILDARNREIGFLWNNESLHSFFEQHPNKERRAKKPIRVVVKEIS
jgi:hypothetical protein